MEKLTLDNEMLKEKVNQLENKVDKLEEKIKNMQQIISNQSVKIEKIICVITSNSENIIEIKDEIVKK